jgi:transcriptional regulator with XRE-family HTH domain
VERAIQPIARNLRRWRMTREMTLSALAAQAGVAKSTVSLLERGRGNPSIQTVWALASALGVPFASLFQEESPAHDVLVVRESEGSLITPDEPGAAREDGLVIRHMLTRTGGSLIEIYTLALEPGAMRRASAHVSGLLEHVTVAAGTVEISTDSFSEIVSEGDLISFRADRQHTYRALDGPARLVAVHEYPPRVTLA